MRTPTAELRQAFYRTLLQALPIGAIRQEDICWPNTGFRPDPKRIYLAPFMIFNETRTATLSPNGYEELNGIFQIAICGLPGQGEGEMDGIAAALTDIFRGGTTIDMCDWLPITIRRAWRTALRFGSDSQSNAGRPSVVVSVAWQQYTPKGGE